MAKIKGTEELSVNELVIDDTQARFRGVSKEIDDLAESIRMHGLLEPIVVCPDPKGGYHVLMGQRRLLAHRKLGRTKILAAIIDEPVDQITAKVLSLTENLIRQDLDTKDVIDACTALYKKYGNAKAVAEATGLPYPKVLRHVKYDRLVPSMRALVDAGEVNIDMALRAQDAAAANGNLIQAEAVELARQLAPLTGAQQRQILKMKQTHPERSARDLLERTPRGARSKQLIVTLSAAELRKLQSYARVQGITQDQAAAKFISEGLAKTPSTPIQEAGQRSLGGARSASVHKVRGRQASQLNSFRSDPTDLAVHDGVRQ